MTNEQKAVAKATYDGRVYDPIYNCYRHKDYSRTEIALLTELYLTQLNYLAAVASKAQQRLPTIVVYLIY